MNNLNLSATKAPKLLENITLSNREKEILHLIAHEHNDKEMAQKLYLSYHTIHTYRKKLMKKLGVTKCTGLVRRSFELGIFQLNA